MTTPDWVTTPDWLHRLDTCPSTNTWALEHLPDLQHGDVVFTKRQTAGRGQPGRAWAAPPGVLTASFVLDASMPLSGFSLVAGLAVIYAIEDLLPGLNLQLKWPNDIWLQQRKLAGILCEAAANRLVVGVGCNCLVNFSAEAQTQLGNPISLHQVVDAVPNSLKLLTTIRDCLLQAVSFCAFSEASDSPGLTKLLPALNYRNALKGRRVTVRLPQETIVIGDVVGIDASGRLLIKRADRTIQPVVSGHVVAV